MSTATIGFYITVLTDQGRQQSKKISTREMTDLKNLFFDNSVWKGNLGGVGNVLEVTVDQAEALYRAVIAHYAQNTIDAELYQGVNFTGPFRIVRGEQELFDELIEFFEASIGFTSSEESKKAIANKRQGLKGREEQARKEYRKWAVDFFDQCHRLNLTANPAILFSLKYKYQECRECIEQCEPQSRDVAFRFQEDFRAAVYKSLLIDAVLNATKEVNLGDLAKELTEKYGDRFNHREFYKVCCIVSDDLGTPQRSSHIFEFGDKATKV